MTIFSVWNLIEKETWSLPCSLGDGLPSMGFMAIPGTLRQQVMAGVPLSHDGGCCQSSLHLCGLYVRTRCHEGGHQATSIGVSARGSFLSLDSVWLCVTHLHSSTGLFAGSWSSGCNFSTQSQLSHSCLVSAARRPPLGPTLPKEAFISSYLKMWLFSWGLALPLRLVGFLPWSW